MTNIHLDSGTVCARVAKCYRSCVVGIIMQLCEKLLTHNEESRDIRAKASLKQKQIKSPQNADCTDIRIQDQCILPLQTASLIFPGTGGSSRRSGRGLLSSRKLGNALLSASHAPPISTSSPSASSSASNSSSSTSAPVLSIALVSRGSAITIGHVIGPGYRLLDVVADIHQICHFILHLFNCCVR